MTYTGFTKGYGVQDRQEYLITYLVFPKPIGLDIFIDNCLKHSGHVTSTFSYSLFNFSSISFPVIFSLLVVKVRIKKTAQRIAERFF